MLFIVHSIVPRKTHIPRFLCRLRNPIEWGSSTDTYSKRISSELGSDYCLNGYDIHMERRERETFTLGQKDTIKTKS